MKLTCHISPVSPRAVSFDETASLYAWSTYEITVIAAAFREMSPPTAEISITYDGSRYAHALLTPDPVRRDRMTGVLALTDTSFETLYNRLAAANQSSARSYTVDASFRVSFPSDGSVVVDAPVRVNVVPFSETGVTFTRNPHVDSELSGTSFNPVRNSVVTARFEVLEQRVADSEEVSSAASTAAEAAAEAAGAAAEAAGAAGAAISAHASSADIHVDRTFKANVSDHVSDLTVHTTLADKQAASKHIASRANPHAVTKQQVGLGNVDNTSDRDKPVSTAVKAYVDDRVSRLSASLSSFTVEVHDVLPAAGRERVIYVVPAERAGVDNVHDEYLWIEGKWEKIGSSELDLSGYSTVGHGHSIDDVDGLRALESTVGGAVSDISELRGLVSEADNVIETVKVDGEALSVADDKSVDISSSAIVTAAAADVKSLAAEAVKANSEVWEFFGDGVEPGAVYEVRYVWEEVGPWYVHYLYKNGEEVGSYAGWPDPHEDEVYFSSVDITARYVSSSNALGLAMVKDVPTKVSQLENDAGYARQQAVPTKVSQLENDKGYLTEHQDITGLATRPYVDARTYGKSLPVTDHEEESGVAVVEKPVPVKKSYVQDFSLDYSVSMTADVYSEKVGDDNFICADVYVDGALVATGRARFDPSTPGEYTLQYNNLERVEGSPWTLHLYGSFVSYVYEQMDDGYMNEDDEWVHDYYDSRTIVITPADGELDRQSSIRGAYYHVYSYSEPTYSSIDGQDPASFRFNDVSVCDDAYTYDTEVSWSGGHEPYNKLTAKFVSRNEMMLTETYMSNYYLNWNDEYTDYTEVEEHDEVDIALLRFDDSTGKWTLVETKASKWNLGYTEMENGGYFQVPLHSVRVSDDGIVKVMIGDADGSADGDSATYTYDISGCSGEFSIANYSATARSDRPTYVLVDTSAREVHLDVSLDDPVEGTLPDYVMFIDAKTAKVDTISIAVPDGADMVGPGMPESLDQGKVLRVSLTNVSGDKWIVDHSEMERVVEDE